MRRMKVGIVVPYSWSFWGAVVEHAELQSEALRAHGCEVKTIMGNDPPGQFTRVLHPRHGRHGDPPDDVIAIGRSVIVPANGSLPNIILSPRSFFRIRQALEREHFDVLHLHEPMTPIPCIAALAIWHGPSVGTFHASGDLGWMRIASPSGASSPTGSTGASPSPTWPPARRNAGSAAITTSSRTASSSPTAPSPAGVHTGSSSPAGTRRARAPGAAARLAGDPPAHGRRPTRDRRRPAAGPAPADPAARSRRRDRGARLPDQDRFTDELLAAKALVAPSLGGESFGMVLTRAFACATPVVASDISGYRDVMTPETSRSFPPGDEGALVDAVEALLADEPRREAMGAAARALAQERYSWDAIAHRLVEVYSSAVAGEAVA